MRKVLDTIFVSAFLSLSFLSAACADAQQKSNLAVSDLSSGERDAAFKMAAARCDRQTPACGTALPRDACIQRKLVPSAADVELENCSSAIDEQNLNSCVIQIRAGQCGTGIVRLDACSHDSLCPGVAEEGTI